jgi:ubiquitin C-terminal hydrolase
MGRFVSEINISNPLSRSKGKMSISLANVLTRMLDQKKPFVLTFLKRSVAEFWGLYDPYQQQDAEEILNFFLDSLHEELNNAPRVKYTPKEDLPDKELAEEFYKSHSSLNQSVIADTFQGFYKSKLSCPKCGHESRKFDPFMNLSIEVPAPPTFLEVLVIDSVVDLSKRRISIPIQESSLMKDIYKCILARLENPANVDLIGVVIENLKITHILDKEKPLLSYSDSLENIV